MNEPTFFLLAFLAYVLSALLFRIAALLRKRPGPNRATSWPWRASRSTPSPSPPGH